MGLNEKLRDRILDDLSTQFSQDRLGMEEYEQRVKAVSAARDDNELIKINADILPAHAYLQAQDRGTPPAAGVKACPGQLMINYGEAPKHHDAVAIFSSSELNGEFLAAQKLDAVAIFGGTIIDLRKAAIPVDGMTIEVAAIFGACTIILPPGANTQISGVGIFGGFNKPRASFDTGGPRITISGAAIFGGVDIRFQQQF